MLKRIGVVALAGAQACAVAEGPAERERESHPRRTFAVDLSQATTPENVVQQILDAGRPELVAACADMAASAIRVLNPLVPGEHSDVMCAEVLHSIDGATDAVAALPTDGQDELVGEVQQAWSPLGLGCHIFVLASALVAHRGICPRATNPRDARRCTNWSEGGFAGLTIMCAFL